MRHISPWRINAALAILLAGLLAFAFLDQQPAGDSARLVPAAPTDLTGILRASYPESPYP